MNNKRISFMEKSATKEYIYSHLYACNNDYCQKLSNEVDLRDYANKIFQRSITFEAWSMGELVGLVATYLNDLDSRSGFITNVSVTRKYKDQGIASKLIEMCIKKAIFLNFHFLHLEVSTANYRAISLYKQYGFTQFQTNDKTIFMRHVLGVDGRHE